MKSKRITLGASRDQNGAVACAQVAECHCWWAFIGKFYTADTPLEIAVRHGGGVKVSGTVVKEIGVAEARVPQDGEESGEAHPKACFPIGDVVSHTDGFGASKPEDG